MNGEELPNIWHRSSWKPNSRGVQRVQLLNPAVGLRLGIGARAMAALLACGRAASCLAPFFCRRGLLGGALPLLAQDILTASFSPVTLQESGKERCCSSGSQEVLESDADSVLSE